MSYGESTNVSEGTAVFIFRVELEYEGRSFFFNDENLLQYSAVPHHTVVFMGYYSLQ
jgi:hypothetical protein